MYSMMKYPVNPESIMEAVKNFGKCSRENSTSPTAWEAVVLPVRTDILVECIEPMDFTMRVRDMMI